MQRIIGILLGGLTIYLLLNIMDALTSDTQPKYLLAIVIDMIVALLWPWFIAFILARRVRDRRKEEIDREVQEQMAAQKRDG